MKIEICCGDYESMLSAVEGGAERIELCAGLSEGGLTPSLGLIRAAVKLNIPQINVLIRPRKGDFCYTQRELALMKEEIKIAVAEGATGIVSGALTPEGDIDMGALLQLREAAPKTRFTFHRAFDLCADPMKSLQEIMTVGCTTLLTSGQANSALAGAPLIRQLVEKAAGRIEIMAGSGITSANVEEVVDATGVRAVHTSARKPVESAMTFRKGDVNMGKPGDNEYTRLITSADEVALVIKKVRNRQ